MASLPNPPVDWAPGKPLIQRTHQWCLNLWLKPAFVMFVDVQDG